ncbi:MAG: hypothetical protein LPJ89_08445 [Hymenobacteraceae bacterium]|mgnify:CR=1 FL=1|nr:hypothetical protein [Hymenobacteraceae bacterium]MDX5443793.1 hypothetical protein [Hymenobacteraceae bacterium]MDX5512927.1 hypothetical protein [Hymenobacteraceae bacterium]
MVVGENTKAVQVKKKSTVLQNTSECGSAKVVLRTTRNRGQNLHYIANLKRPILTLTAMVFSPAKALFFKQFSKKSIKNGFAGAGLAGKR